MKKFTTLALVLLSACAGIQRNAPETPTAPPSAADDFRTACERYVEGFNRFFTIEARIKNVPFADPGSPRDLFEYLKARPRWAEAELATRRRALRALRAATPKQPNIATALAQFHSRTRECDYGNVPYGWANLVEFRKEYAFDRAELKKLRREVLAYLRDDESVAVELASVSARVKLADAAVKSKFFKMDKVEKRKLLNLKTEIESDTSRPLTALDTDSRVKSTIEDVSQVSKLFRRLRKILPAK